MKKLIITLFHLLILSQITHSQYNSGKITYEGTLTLAKKIANLHKAPKQFRSKMLATYKNIRPVSFTLIFNTNEALLEKNEPLQLDNAGINLAYYQDSDKVRYANISENYQLRSKEVRGDNYLIRSPFNKWKWKISSQTKKVGKYVCYKATASMEQATQKGIKKTVIYAWFCPEISFPFGPHSFGGLPGMILELTINNFTYKAKKVIINKSKLNISAPNKGEKISQQEFLKLESSIWEGIKNMRN